jgi:Tol biopolymer transport system component
VKRGFQPRWSPDGERISFMSRRDGNWEIHVINADGSGKKRLTHDRARDAVLAWSPDGQLISFARYHHGNWDSYVMSADGSGLRHLPRNVWPVWSPDGRKIALVRKLDIYVMNADGSGDSLGVVTNVGRQQRHRVQPA